MSKTPNPPSHHARLADILLLLETEMRREGLWESRTPSDEALSSVIPFAHDTLEFTQWLQWIFIPKNIEILESGKPLPGASDIAPLAEYRFEEIKENTGQMLALIKQFDELIQEISEAP